MYPKEPEEKRIFNDMSQRKLFIIVVIWFLISLAFPMLDAGLNRDAITTLLVLAYFLLSLLWFYKKGRFVEVKNPKRTFIAWCVINAMVIEIFHMISNPLHASLLITSRTSLFQALHNTLVDLTLTFPAYILIFLVICYLAVRYRYSAFSFFFLMALGQALGDGNNFFLTKPGALIFIPYVMLNYWAMNFVPYLTVRNTVASIPPENDTFKKNMLPIIVLPVIYIIAGGIILALGKVLGWIPR